MNDTRETGFVNAITSAGVTYSITRACTAGSLLECSCEKGAPKPRRGREPVALPPSQVPTDSWQWGGCSDNVRFGLKKSREFMDSRYRKRSDIKTLIKLHNHHAGRLVIETQKMPFSLQAIKNNMKIECKCHGLSGSCTLRTCWWRMPTFREVGDRLRDRFEGAAKVIASNDGDSFMPETPSIKRPGKKDIIYSEESPDFCFPNSFGSLGTQSRQCNVSSAGTDSCDQMCCRRGYTKMTVSETENCNCQFKWCCEVICETCYVKRNIQTINNSTNTGEKHTIYYEESPDFCFPNFFGSIGTQIRQFNAVTNSCDQMCCRRGYIETTIRETENCNCQFKWCCVDNVKHTTSNRN
ncbi:Protein Wnt, partial [Operophtera brumata]